MCLGRLVASDAGLVIFLKWCYTGILAVRFLALVALELLSREESDTGASWPNLAFDNRLLILVRRRDQLRVDHCLLEEADAWRLLHVSTGELSKAYVFQFVLVRSGDLSLRNHDLLGHGDALDFGELNI